MCGIAGIFNMDGMPADRSTMQRMLDVQRHRGPDDQGVRMFCLEKSQSEESEGARSESSFPGILGFNRLSILDLSAHGHQPMANRDESVFIAFNGEVYNAFDHTRELEAAGYQFRSRTDTEVLLYLYEEHGFEGMLSRLNGMFAIVIVDLRKARVYIARDQLGVKPFYWWSDGRTLLFSSEVKSFVVHPAFRAELDLQNLDEYLAYRYCAGEGTLLKGVKQLRPGHLMVVTSSGVSVRRYWEIPDESVRFEGSEAEALDTLQERLSKAVERQLIADVKVGCQLSGGIDSSLVGVFARSHFQADMDTFSVVFDDQAYSEENWISRAAVAANADSHRFMFTPDHFFRTLEPATWHLDQPLNHPNSLGIYRIAERARSEVTVLLSGEGADELMGGYMRFYYAMVQPKIAPWLPLLRRAPGLGAKFERNFGPANDPVGSFVAASMFQLPNEVLQLRREANLGGAVERRRQIFGEGRSDHLSNCLKADMQTYLVDLLVRQDKMTMAHSMENRVPFLDLDLVSFVRRLPARYLVGTNIRPFGNRMANTKVLLKKLAERTFPADFVYRRKSGFSLPLARYFSDERFRELMEDRLLPGIRQRGLMDAEVVRQRWTRLPDLRRGMDEVLWIPVAFELWAQQYLDGRFPVRS